jgi:hypothetical protein
MKLCPKCGKQFSDDANFCPVDAARLGPATAVAVESAQNTGGDAFAARFELGGKVGGKRTGEVYDANDKQNNQRVALKIVSPMVVAGPGAAARLERECKQLEKVNSAGIAKLVGVGKRGDDTWVCTEFVAGAQSLATAIADRGAIGLAGAAEIVEVVGEALVEAAQAGVVHRDLSPKNILFAGDEIKLINFSVPVMTTEKSPGVAEFVAPEVVEGKPADQRSNIYSLGAIFYLALTGRAPFVGDVQTVHQAHLTQTPAAPSTIVPVSAEVDALVMRAMERSPSKRFLTVRQFVDEALRVARSVGGPVGVLANQAAGATKKRELVQTLTGLRAIPRISQPPPVAALASSIPQTMIGTPSIGGGADVKLVSAPSATIAGSASAPAAPSASPSPWAAPAVVATPMVSVVTPAIAPAAAVPVAPVLTAAVNSVMKPSAPVLAAPVVASKTPGTSKPADDSKGKFRETMWFKKGELDVAAAEAAAAERARTGKDAANDKVDSLPMDERYKDDGSITRSDKEKYSLRTGGTQMMQAIKDPTAASSMTTAKVTEDALIGEMKGGRTKLFVMVGIAIAIVVAALIVFSR